MRFGIIAKSLRIGVAAFAAAGILLAAPAAGLAKNIIFMVPDGMGLAYVTAARIYQNGANGSMLNLENFDYIGYQRTHSLNSTVTDSAAAGSAWATGYKYNNGEISCLDINKDSVCDRTDQTILEFARAKGMSTGLVATSDITHATPAAFGAHAHNRKCEYTIARNFLSNEIDVLLGGGFAKDRSSCLFDDSTDAQTDALIQSYQQAGYTYVTTKSGMQSAQGSAGKLLGLFKSGGLTPEYIKSSASTEPSLAEMTQAALAVLEKDSDGFFLMVEGSQVDWAGHANNIVYLIGEVLAFDKAVKVVQDWMAADASRAANTMVVVVADHETGGFGVNGPYGSFAIPGDSSKPLKETSGKPDEEGEPVTKDGAQVYLPNTEAGWTSGGHTAMDTIVWSNQPNLGRPMNNTDLFHAMKAYID